MSREGLENSSDVDVEHMRKSRIREEETREKCWLSWTGNVSCANNFDRINSTICNKIRDFCCWVSTYCLGEMRILNKIFVIRFSEWNQISAKMPKCLVVRRHSDDRLASQIIQSTCRCRKRAMNIEGMSIKGRKFYLFSLDDVKFHQEAEE